MTTQVQRAVSPTPTAVDIEAPWNGSDPDFHLPAGREPRVGWLRRLFLPRSR